MALPKKVWQEIGKIMTERRKVFDESLRGSDRDAAIVAVCLIDNLLERILKSYFINNGRAKRLFENEHVLQTYYAKVNIAYFCGLIPSFLFNDLLLIGRIRNKFAHKLDSKISFSNTEISKLVTDFKLKPKSTEDDIKNVRIKYVATISAISGLLTFIQFMIIYHKQQGKLILLRDILRLDESPFDEISLTEHEIQKLISKSVVRKRRSAK